MCKVAIVDDDRIIRRGLKSVIPWEEYGFSFVGEAGDGEEGLALIEREQPHIVVSDIKMPFMDGLEMAKMVKKKAWNTKIILLTGYEDFKYAHEAIKVKAFDYLLKPVETVHLVEKLNAARKEWEEENQKETLLEKTIPYQHRLFLDNWCLNKISDEEINRKFNHLIHPSLTGYYYALYIQLDSQYDTDIMRLHAKNEVMKIIRKLLDTYSINHEALYGDKEDLYLLTGLDTNSPLEAELLIKNFSEELVAIVQTSGQTTVTITMGEGIQRIQDLHLSLLGAKSAMNQRFRMGKNTAYSINDIKLSSIEVLIDYRHFEDELVRSINLGLSGKAEDQFDRTKSLVLHNNKLSLEEISLLMLRINSLLFRDFNKWDKQRFIHMQKKMITMQTIEELFDCMKVFAVDLADYVRLQNMNLKETIVDKAVACIREKYHMEDLSLQKVADEVHVSPAYLSSLFKAEKGFNFSECVMETRMKAAMQFFRETDLKTYEISDKIGYSNPRYFSSCFKKYTGHTPAEYRKLT
ncbi:response regulator transcription factor [Peribacillus sp. NPDC097675]|uniref:response regulator transcription factor n=1 Tax=Peribacillus sp. NPDC097675 TaxID=3390618 RepID=UPI003D03012B